MAVDVTADVFDTPEQEQAAAPLLRKGLTSARRKNKPLMAQVDEALAEGAKVANTGYAKLWDFGQDILEQFALGFWTLGNILVAPIIVFVFLLRFIVGGFMHGGFEVGFRTFLIKAVPKMAVYDIRRPVMVIFLSILFMIQIILLIIIWRAATDPTFATRLGMCVKFHVLCEL